MTEENQSFRRSAGPMALRSLLFVPGDRPERFARAAASGADALILDLEASVMPDRKAFARQAVADWLSTPRPLRASVRICGPDPRQMAADLGAIMPGGPDGIVFPKAEGAASIERLLALIGAGSVIPILPIASETPAGIFRLGEYAQVGAHLAGLTWGVEDLATAVGSVSSRGDDGRYTAPYQVVRGLTLFGAHAAGIPAIETVFPGIDDADALAAHVARAWRDGFTGMLAIHPAQVAVINRGFAPTDEEVAQARTIAAAFAAEPGIGALKLAGKMIDRPHLLKAERLLAAAGL